MGMSASICHPHNLRAPPPASRPFGIRVSAKPGDPFARLVAPDWHKLHWYATELERDAALADMSEHHRFSRIGDEPTLVFEKLYAAPGTRRD